MSAQKPITASILRRVAVQTMGVTSLTAVILTLLTFLIARSIIEQRIHSQLTAVAHEKKQLIEQRLAADRQRTAILAKDSAIKVSTTLRTLQEQGVPVTGIALFNTHGIRIAGAGAAVAPLESTTTILVPHFTDQG